MKGDSAYMHRAVALARKGLGRTAPNPPVGAVVVKDGTVVGEGFHPRAGQPHAEVFALRAAGKQARGATLYVTLEPCSHFGRTPPCTKAVIEAGIARVVVGSVDPNPVVAGSGIRILREHGIKVRVGVAAKETDKLITWYGSWMERKRPFVIAKAAMTLDGRIATPAGDSKWISSEESRAYVHALRNHVDAILVGIGTVLADDPRLTCRLPGGRDPLRVIIDPGYRVPDTALCLGERSLIFTASDPAVRPEVLSSGSRVVRLGTDASGHFSWEEILDHLGALGLHSVLVEGGRSILSSLVQSRLADELLLFVAPKILGGGVPLVAFDAPDTIAMALPLVIQEARVIGGDVLITASLEG
ncbi:MAG TPA: bifunctional diaminohydroxyphosphoribosylaminopyrimidine deaminase/5-amino-6-(5-phosphoribosylamino)uracil reductase RibD [Deltaproteobacteria bacterium]|jgi:diaminohydroxyphosphoribosylaminopyrimidine deaminase/5-amino-6-(5-phosphoribosylamino)uracil reductase|nr:bifunctional diaminohydroxyphosphoribosylaminopyrimidine deaminase/5-amino-6-(5-phosphoribosylamino)uracil reductase RibD [Deltaproteobacteria bacterium]HOI07440.1 bifunctional diaminohydroxyphosphoribosylaminopyrimidine deaminase/5-amino-6-(5-phosphoribosylamino)uracil reductase RibD [Deltaproteobacteria bacterium]